MTERLKWPHFKDEGGEIVREFAFWPSIWGQRLESLIDRNGDVAVLGPCCLVLQRVVSSSNGSIWKSTIYY